MNNRIFPTWQQIDSFRNPLTDGERALAKYLDKYLPVPWEIFVQPFCNGDRPDIIILNKKVGLVIFEVKDWNPLLYKSKEILVNNKNKKPFSYRKYFVDDRGRDQEIPSPLSQVERYRKNLLNLYCPNIGESIDKNTKAFAAFKVAIYMHAMTTEKAKKLIITEEKRCVVFGKDYLECGDRYLNNIVLDVNRGSSMWMNDKWYKSIRFWLMPPFHSIEQGQNLILSNEQRRHINPSPNTHQRLRGVAGSGKTLVLAQRAANIASEGKRVLIVYYNITLGHYIRDHVKRTRVGFYWNNIEFKHYHGFCRDYLYENDINWPSETDDTKTLMDKTVPELVTAMLKVGCNKKRRKYDAILIDEGQDFNKSWYDMLSNCLNENDELLIVVDEKQNLYLKDNSWIDSMVNTKFRGRWRELKQSYRVPEVILKASNSFAEIFLPEIGIKAEKTVIQDLIHLPVFQSHYIWRNLTIDDDFKDKILNAVKWLIKVKEQHPSDIVILVPTHKIGWEIVEIFEKIKYRVNHVFEKPDEFDEHQNRKKKIYKHNKKSFWMGDGRLKICTIHSFKGWEIMNTILLTPLNDEKSNSKIDYLIYTSITRTRMNIIVFNQNPRYNEYGETWPSKW